VIEIVLVVLGATSLLPVASTAAVATGLEWLRDVSLFVSSRVISFSLDTFSLYLYSPFSFYSLITAIQSNLHFCEHIHFRDLHRFSTSDRSVPNHFLAAVIVILFVL